jgi:hypothetical protein
MRSSIRLILTVAGLCLLAPANAHAERSASDPPPTVIDWSKSHHQATPANCGAFAFKNMENDKSYLLWVKGTAPGTCSFRADGLTFHFPSNFGPTTAGAATVFSFARYGNDVLVSWNPGY